MNVIEQVDTDQKPEDSEQSEESKNSTESGKMYIVGSIMTLPNSCFNTWDVNFIEDASRESLVAPATVMPY